MVTQSHFKGLVAPLKKFEASVFIVDDLVTLARSVFQAVVVLDCHVPARIGNEARLVQDARCHGDTGTARAQHHAQKFVARIRSLIWTCRERLSKTFLRAS